MKKLCFLILIIIFCSKSNAQFVEPTIVFSTLTLMENYTGTYFQAIVTDSATGGLFTKQASTHSANNTVTYPCATSGFLWFRLGASPLGSFVKYSDSTVVFVTPHQLRDSLNNYVNLYGVQTLLSTADKTSDGQWVFNDTTSFNARVQAVLNGTDFNSWRYIDTIGENGKSGYKNVFVNTFSNINTQNNVNGSAPAGTVFGHNIYKLNQNPNDTFYSLASNRGVIEAQTSFTTNLTNPDSLVVYLNPVSSSVNQGLVSMLSAFNISDDSTLLTDTAIKWKVHLPVVLYDAQVGIAKHGTIDSLVFERLGRVSYLSDAGDFTIPKAYGLLLEPLAGDGTIQSARAIDQQGTQDSVFFKSRGIVMTGLPTATLSYTTGLDANNVLSKKAVYQATATLDFPNTTTQTNSDLTITVTGASVGDFVQLAPAIASITTNSNYTAWVSASNTVKVRFSNFGTSDKDPDSGSFSVLVTHQ